MSERRRMGMAGATAAMRYQPVVGERLCVMFGVLCSAGRGQAF